MSRVRFPLVGGEAMRVTKQDRCGRPAYGNFAMAASDGFVSVAVTANYEDGEDVSVTNARGKKCVNRKAEPELTDLSVTATFCDVDPDIYTTFTGFPQIIDPKSGAVIGFRINRRKGPADVSVALEVWSAATGTVGCDDDEDVPYGYLLWPFLTGGRVGDYTIENGAVTFSVTDMRTKDGSQWGVGPYLVQTDEDGDADFLQEPVDVMDHQWVLRTLVAPPEPTAGLVPLDDPDGALATVGTAAQPGTFNGIRPADFPTLDTSAITASPSTSWTAGQYVILGDGSYAHWEDADGAGSGPGGWERGKAA